MDEPRSQSATCLQRPRARAGVTLVEMMAGFTIVLMMGAVLLPALTRAREQARRSHCMNNMRQLGMFFRLHADDHNGQFPPGAKNQQWGTTGKGLQIRNNYTVDASALEGYMSDFQVFVCHSSLTEIPYERNRWYTDVSFMPQHLAPKLRNDSRNRDQLAAFAQPAPDPECLTNQMYGYIPYAVIFEAEALFLWDELDRRMDAGAVDFLNADIPVSGPWAPGGHRTFMRLRDGVERAWIRDVNNPAASHRAQAEIPVLYDAATIFGRIRFNHVLPLGGNVLYLDGSVRFSRFPNPSGRIPYTFDFLEWTRKNTYNNATLENVPPWCANRLPGTPFEPRYIYYPDDPRYAGLYF